MGAIEPFINILTVLTVLSVAAERVTNVVKLRRDSSWKENDNREREFKITWSNVLIGIAIAIAMKADLFAMLAQPDSPWTTLGWTQWNGTVWVRHPAAGSLSGIAQALLGSAMTGISLGFGSTFWHDVLGIVLELRKLTEKRAAAQPNLQPGGGE
jgi:hypothetical protein